MGKLSDRFAALSPEQRELLARKLKQKGMDSLMPVVLKPVETGRSQTVAQKEEASAAYSDKITNKAMQFSLFFFSDNGSVTGQDKYRLLIECARYADQHDFVAVWTPERHFQDFGGLYPNPSVLSAALAMITERVQIRAGSVALPLHHPARVAEEWSVVDNLSKGRAAVSFASGWHPADFIFSPNTYDDRKEVMFDYIEKIQRLWAGEKVIFKGVQASDVEIKILPRPLQPKLPMWITTAGSPRTWEKAGEVGANILAALGGYSFEDLARMIELYRDSLIRHGHDPESGIVTLMLHTFLGEDVDVVKETVRAPMCNYLRTYMKQQENVAIDPDSITEADKDLLVSFAFENYFETNTLLGTVDKCAKLVAHLLQAGVDEIACLVDFGLDVDSVIEGLGYLNELKEKFRIKAEA
jgi:natural product biosynthesis luciferase-like monooxygenase protein